MTHTQDPPGSGRAVPLYGPQYRQNPADVYRRMRREHGPVAPILLEGDIPAWLVLGYREMHQVTTDIRLYGRDCRRWNQWDRVPDDWPLMPWVAYSPLVCFTEGEEHLRRSRAISDTIAAVDPFELQGYCERFADQVIDRFAGKGGADLVADYAYRVPALVMCRLFGLPDNERENMRRDLTATVIADEDAIPAGQRAVATIAQLVKARREEPGSDMTSQFIANAPDLTDEQLVADLMLMMTAALPCTACWIGNTVRLMLTDDRFALTLSGGRGSVGQALNEVLWADSPMQNLIGRYATQDTVLGGQRVRTGDLIVLGLAAANTDPQLWPDSAGGFAGNNAYMSFSHGDYGCPIGAPDMAKTIAQTAIEVLLDRLPDIDLAVPPEQLEWMDSLWYRGLTALPITFSPTHATGD